MPGIGSVPMTPDELMPQVPEMPGMSKPDFEAANNPQGLAGNPHFRPNLPGNIARALRQPEVIDKISGQSGKGKERRDPEDEIPKDVKKRGNTEE